MAPQRPGTLHEQQQGTHNLGRAHQRHQPGDLQKRGIVPYKGLWKTLRDRHVLKELVQPAVQ